MKTVNNNETTTVKSFNDLRAEAKALGINTNKMNREGLEKAIAEKQVTVIVGEKVERRGRPVNGDSERQKRLAGYQAKIESGVELKRGRPVDPTTPRQQRIQARLEKMNSGVEIKRGRPAAPKAEPVVEAPVVEAKAPKAKKAKAVKVEAAPIEA